MDSLDAAKPQRATSSRGRRKGATGAEVTSAGEETQDERLNIRVKDRMEDSLSNKKGRIGGIFKETPISGLLKDSPAEKLKRPLTGMSNLFRRPGSRAGRQKEDDSAASTEPLLFDRGGSPMPPRNQTPPAHRYETDFASYAPHVASTQLQGFIQDNMAARRPYMTSLEHVDVSFLPGFICFEDESQEEANSWGFDYLFTSLSNEMRDDWVQDRKME